MRLVAWWLRVARGGADSDAVDELSMAFTVTPPIEVGGPFGFGHRAHHPDPNGHYVFEADELHRPHADDPGVPPHRN